jgi:hypothetical protein
LGKEYRSLSSSLCIFLHSPVTSSLLGPNTLLSTAFSNNYTLRSSLNVSDQASHPYKTTDKIIILYILIFKFLDNLEDKRFWTETSTDVKHIQIKSTIRRWSRKLNHRLQSTLKNEWRYSLISPYAFTPICLRTWMTSIFIKIFSIDFSSRNFQRTRYINFVTMQGEGKGFLRLIWLNVTKNINMGGGGWKPTFLKELHPFSPLTVLSVSNIHTTVESGVTRYFVKCRWFAQNALTSLIQCRSTVSRGLSQIPKS